VAFVGRGGPPTRAEVQALNDGLVAAIALLNELRAAGLARHTPALTRSVLAELAGHYPPRAFLVTGGFA